MKKLDYSREKGFASRLMRRRKKVEWRIEQRKKMRGVLKGHIVQLEHVLIQNLLTPFLPSIHVFLTSSYLGYPHLHANTVFASVTTESRRWGII